MLLGDKQIIYEKLIDDICKKEELGKITSEEAGKMKQKVGLSMGLERYCCKMRLMTYKRLIDIIV
jgi:DNA-directed RNA polymerase subunit N (RpoN/RPB10)